MHPVAPGCALAAQGSERPSSGCEVADIFRHYGDTSRRAYAVPLPHHKVIDDIVTCRTAALGGHVEWCQHCGFERYAYNSCRNRHCPKCQVLTKARWLEARKAELLPCIFTLATGDHKISPKWIDSGRVRPSLPWSGSLDRGAAWVGTSFPDRARTVVWANQARILQGRAS